MMSVRISLKVRIAVNNVRGGAEFAGPENGGPKKNKGWKIQDLENDGPVYSVSHGEWMSHLQIADRPSSVRVCVRMHKNKWLLFKRGTFNCF